MKKLLLGFAIIAMTVLTSCTKETTYTFTDNMDYFDTSIRRLTILSEYDANGSRIANNSIESPITGQSYMFVADERSELVKVYISYGSTYAWVKQVYYLNKGKNTEIMIDGHTIVGPSEP